jgi:hypothetical protein
MREYGKRWRRCHQPKSHKTSAADGVPQNNHALEQASLLEQLQIQAHTIREEPFSAADNHGADSPGD